MPRKRSSPKRESTVTGIAPAARERDGRAHERRVEQAAAVVAHQHAVDRRRGTRAARARAQRRAGLRAGERRVAVEPARPAAWWSGRGRRGPASSPAWRSRSPWRCPVVGMRFSRRSARSLPPVRRRRPGRRTAAAGAERADVVDGVRPAAEPHVGRVVAQDQHRRLAADALDAAVDELVGDQVGEHQHAPPAEASHQRLEPARGRGVTSSRPRIRSTASSRFSATRSGWRGQPGGQVGELAQPVPALHQRPARADVPGELQVGVAVADHPRARAGRRRARPRRARSRPGRGLRQSQSARYGASPTDGWCRHA